MRLVRSFGILFVLCRLGRLLVVVGVVRKTAGPAATAVIDTEVMVAAAAKARERK
jgi:hypothetical protein